MKRLIGQGNLVGSDQRIVITDINADKQRLQSAVYFNPVGRTAAVFGLIFGTPSVDKGDVFFTGVDRKVF